MEEWYDALRAGTITLSQLVLLRDYYENGVWLADYERDERGELPPGLKRGVLSQDGLYDLLRQNEERTL